LAQGIREIRDIRGCSRLAYSPNGNRCSHVPVEVYYRGGKQFVTVNQKLVPPIDGLFVSLGVFEFGADQSAAVVISNQAADGFVVIDAVQWLPQ
jgi:hypothetical protein